MNDQVQGFWQIFDRATPEMRRDWLLELLRPALERPPGVSAIVGRGRLSDLRAAWSCLDPDAQRRWFGEFVLPVRDLCDIGAADLARGSDAGDKYKPAREFLDACARKVIGARIRSTDLHRHYLKWAATSGAPGFSIRQFALLLQALGYHKVKCSEIYWMDFEVVDG